MSKKEKKKKEFWKKAHFKYKLSATNENTLEEVWKIRTSLFSGAVLFFVLAFMLIIATSFIIIATPVRYYLPGYLDIEIREDALKSAIKIDSLEQSLRYQEVYLNNIRNIIAGTLDVDSVTKLDSVYISEQDPILEKSQPEKEFTSRYEDEEKYTLGVFPTNAMSSGALFYKPITGVLIKHFDLYKKDYFVAIKTNQSETVRASLDGTVIFTGYDIADEYMIHLQHKNGYVSIYKGCSSLVKKVGDQVRTAEAIGVVTEKGEGKGATLIFGLWDKGTPVNPENYIAF